MIQSLSMASLAQKYGGRLMLGDAWVNGLSIDSRTLAEGQLFAALPGENTDGHDFILAAAKKGAQAALVQRPVDADLVQWVVSDVVEAMGQVATECRSQFKGTLFGITGSNGKTTVKEMLAAICGRRGSTLATRGNLNNHLGVPLMLSELAAEHRYAVIEMGASAIGEIDCLASIAQPDVALVTQVGHAHLEGFGSRGGIVRGKGEIYDHVSAAGRAVINLDSYGHEEFLRRATAQQLTFSARAGVEADVRATDIRIHLQGSSWRLVTPLGETPIEQRQLGMNNVYNGLASAAAALAAGFSLNDIRQGLTQSAAVAGRLFPRGGLAGCNLLDDSYNANPDSVAAAIDVLASCAGRRILVLGDMAELGNDEVVMHRQAGELARLKGIDCLVTVGDLAAEAARAYGDKAKDFDNTGAAAEWLLQEIDANTTLLVKGSRSARMERVVEALTPGEKA